MSLMQHYDKVITRMQLDICRLAEEKAEIEACVSDLGLMVKESYKTVPSEFNGSEAEVDVKTTTGESL